MIHGLGITDVHLTPASSRYRADGLLGWVRCELAGALVLDGFAIRRTSGGRATLSFPRRRDRSGREHSIVRPLDEATRLEIERQIFEALGLEGAE